MTGSLQEALDELGPNDPWVKIVLAGRTPSAAAHYYIDGTKLADPAVRKALLEGGQTAVDSSTDPLIVLARQLDPLSRELQKRVENEVESVTTRAGEKLGEARFLVYGKDR